MTDPGGERGSLADARNRVMLAGVYKFMKWLEAQMEPMETRKEMFDLLDDIRVSVGQKRYPHHDAFDYDDDGNPIDYYVMRDYIEQYSHEHALEPDNLPWKRI
jgi:hypothetical protein